MARPSLHTHHSTSPPRLRSRGHRLADDSRSQRGPLVEVQGPESTLLSCYRSVFQHAHQAARRGRLDRKTRRGAARVGDAPPRGPRTTSRSPSPSGPSARRRPARRRSSLRWGKRDSVERHHSSRGAVARALERPTRTHRAGHPRTRPYLGLHRVGFTLFTPAAREELRRGASLRGGCPGAADMVSVALSVGSRRRGVTSHPALRCPDLPPAARARGARAAGDGVMAPKDL